MFLSKRRLAANRANAQKSTGPVTAAGKAAVSKNAIMHGLCGDFYVLDFEDQARFDELLAQFVRDEKPVGSVEHELVVKMARHTWMSHRAIRMQDACLLPQPQTSEQKARGDNALEVRNDLHLYVRYQVQNDRAYQRASQELIQRRKERLKAEIGFASKKRAEADEHRREELHNYRIERYQIAVALDKHKLQAQELIALAQQAGLAEHLKTFKAA
jgi:hypothetical protein